MYNNAKCLKFFEMHDKWVYNENRSQALKEQVQNINS